MRHITLQALSNLHSLFEQEYYVQALQGYFVAGDAYTLIFYEIIHDDPWQIRCIYILAILVYIHRYLSNLNIFHYPPACSNTWHLISSCQSIFIQHGDSHELASASGPTFMLAMCQNTPDRTGCDRPVGTDAVTQAILQYCNTAILYINMYRHSYYLVAWQSVSQSSLTGKHMLKYFVSKSWYSSFA